jgi:hypothetical protein
MPSIFTDGLLRKSLLAAIATLSIAQAADVGCARPAACTYTNARDVCRKAYQRFENDGIYRVSVQNSVAYTAKDGNTECAAELKCDSSGGEHELIGSDIEALWVSLRIGKRIQADC